MRMTEPIADPEQELEAIGPLIPLLFEAFEAATERACQFFEPNSPVDSCLFPELVRYFMKGTLADKVEVVQDFEREAVGHNGLSVIFRGRRIRMWKAHDDELPPAGSSRAKRGFLNQQLALFLSETGDSQLVHLNLVILWNVSSSYRLRRLYLACPKSANGTWVPAESWWTREIQHPAAAALPGESSASPDMPDLPFERTDIESDAQQA